MASWHKVGTALAIAADVRSSADVAALVDATIDQCGALDIVVNNAGVSTRRAAPEDFPEAEIDAILDTNLKGAYLLSVAAARHMIPNRRGVIINIASIAGVAPVGLEAMYSASKAGMIGLTQALARDWGEHGIRVHAVAPGYVESEMNRPIREISRTPAGKRRIPGRRGRDIRARPRPGHHGPHPAGPVRVAGRGRRSRGVPRLRPRSLHDRRRNHG